jgi:hypothetical protein
LQALIHIYEDRLLRQAQALNESVRRGLLEPLQGIQTDALDPVTQTRVILFNPRTQQWSEHFAWSEEGTEIRGVTDCGRATVTALQLNNNIAVTVRCQRVSAGWHPPTE